MFAVGLALTGIVYVAVAVIFAARIERELSGGGPEPLGPDAWKQIAREALTWPYTLAGDLTTGRQVRRHNKTAVFSRGRLAAHAAIEAYLAERTDAAEPLDDIDRARVRTRLDEALAAGDPYAPTSHQFLAGFAAEAADFENTHRTPDVDQGAETQPTGSTEAPEVTEPPVDVDAPDTTLEVARP